MNDPFDNMVGGCLSTKMAMEATLLIAKAVAQRTRPVNQLCRLGRMVLSDVDHDPLRATRRRHGL